MKIANGFKTPLLLLAIVASASVEAAANTIYSNYPSDGVSFSTSFPLAVTSPGNPPPPNYSGYATPFTVTQNEILTDVSVYLAFLSGTANALVNVYSSPNVFGGPQNLIGQGSVASTSPSSAASYNTPIGFDSPGPITLYPGTTYWVAVLPAGPDTNAQWLQSPQNFGALATTTDGQNYVVNGESRGAYTQVNGVDPSAVPEPRTAWLILACLPAFYLLRRRTV